MNGWQDAAADQLHAVQRSHLKPVGPALLLHYQRVALSPDELRLVTVRGYRRYADLCRAKLGSLIDEISAGPRLLGFSV